MNLFLETNSRLGSMGKKYSLNLLQFYWKIIINMFNQFGLFSYIIIIANGTSGESK